MMLGTSATLPHWAFAAQSDAEAAEEGQLETVMVTAERRAENIQDVPVSVSVVNEEQLSALSTSGGDVRILAGKVPSLNIESSNGRTFPRFYIRGYGNTDFTSFASQPVSLVYDDIVQENAALKGFPVFDLASVEVLRGPQGTLFGRNTPAGVVKFDSVRPKLGSMEGYATVSNATYNTANVEGALNLPLGEQWAARVSALYQHRDDWVDNNFIDQNGLAVAQKDALEGYDDSAVRIQALYSPADGAFTALFNIHAHNIDDGTARLFRANIIQKGSNDLVPGFDPARIAIDGANTQSYTSAGGNVRLAWDLGALTLHSITGYETVTNYFTRGDIDAGYGAAFSPPFGPGFIPFPVETAGGLRDHKQITQEVRAESKYDGPLNWQGGAYYFYEDVADDAFTYDTLFGDGTFATYQSSRQENDAWALFGSVSYDLSEAFQVRGGVRYTHDSKDFTLPEISSDPTAVSVTQSESSSKVSWDLSGTYKLTEQTNFYARIATGFRAPSFGSLSATTQQITVAKEETITSYETGIKTELFDRRARIAFDIYYYEVQDQQITAVGGTANQTALINADKTIGSGAELDLEAYITPRLLVTVGGSYNDTEIDDPTLSVPGCGFDSDGSKLCTITDPVTAAGTFSIDGNPLPQAAKWIGNATLRYGFPFSDSSEMYFYTDWSYRSKVTFFLYESEEFTSRELLEGGVRLGYSWQDGKYDAAAFCRNCTDTTRVTGAIDFDNRTGFINDPRIFGVQFRASF
jgi:iron complex outermembrane recepter protein